MFNVHIYCILIFLNNNNIYVEMLNLKPYEFSFSYKL